MGDRFTARTLMTMRSEWHQYPRPIEVPRSSVDSAEAEAFGLDYWRDLPRTQMPPWEDMSAVSDVCKLLDSVPPIVAPNEVDQLTAKLADVCEGRAFVLMGGDCAETFADNTEAHLL